MTTNLPRILELLEAGDIDNADELIRMSDLTSWERDALAQIKSLLDPTDAAQIQDALDGDDMDEDTEADYMYDMREAGEVDFFYGDDAASLGMDV